MLATLRALISFAAYGQSHIVWASNDALSERASGISDRTLRRHIQILCEAGLIERRDSTTRKRYRVSSADLGCETFGLDLSPLLAAASEIAEAAEVERRRVDRIAVLRQRLFRLLGAMTAERQAQLKNLLRRKIDESVLEAEIASVTHGAGVGTDSSSAKLTVPAGQNTRHYSNIDIETEESKGPRSDDESLLDLIRTRCSSTLMFDEQVHDWPSIEALTPKLAQWIGVRAFALEKAIAANGARQTVALLCGIAESAARLRSPPAYFASVSTGRRSSRFSVERFLKSLPSTPASIAAV